MINDPQPRRIGRSILALLAGFVFVVVLSIITDVALHATGTYPALGQPISSGLLLLATTYRTFYGVAGSYITAKLAPHHPMQHALLGGLIGFLLSTAGAIGTWNRPDTVGAHWYPIALIVLAIPAAWLGGKLCLAQLRTRAS